jgi:hypothetical protein
MHGNIRVRTDFFTRPPRISDGTLEQLWKESEGGHPPFTNKRILAEMKKTNREKDYAVIGEIARRMDTPEDMLLYSRSARDILRLASTYPDILETIKTHRKVLAKLPCPEDELEKELDSERRELIHANEKRLSNYIGASEKWATKWSEMQKSFDEMPLMESHAIIIKNAEELLPFRL